MLFNIKISRSNLDTGEVLFINLLLLISIGRIGILFIFYML